LQHIQWWNNFHHQKKHQKLAEPFAEEEILDLSKED